MGSHARRWISETQLGSEPGISGAQQSRGRSNHEDAAALLFDSLFDDVLELLLLDDELSDDELLDELSDDEPPSDLLLDDAVSELDEPERESVR